MSCNLALKLAGFPLLSTLRPALYYLDPSRQSRIASPLRRSSSKRLLQYRCPRLRSSHPPCVCHHHEYRGTATQQTLRFTTIAYFKAAIGSSCLPGDPVSQFVAPRLIGCSSAPATRLDAVPRSHATNRPITRGSSNELCELSYNNTIVSSTEI